MYKNVGLSRSTILILSILALVFCAAFYWLSAVLVPIFVAFFLAYLLNPLIDRMQTCKVNRTLAIVFLIGLAILLMVLALLVFVPAIEQQISRFISRLPNMLDASKNKLIPIMEELSGQQVSELINLGMGKLTEYMSNMSATDLKPLTSLLGKTFSGTYSFVMGIINIFIIPIFTFYFLRDYHHIQKELQALIPLQLRKSVMSLMGEIDDVLSHFVHGQLLVCSILAFLYGIGLAISGVPLGFAIGILAGLAAFIPYFGTILGVTLSVLMVLLDWQGIGPLIGIAVTFSIVQTLESFLITPKVVGDRVGLSPVAVIIALLLGGEILGFAGILIAVPTAAVLKILLKHARKRYEQSEFFVGEENNIVEDAEENPVVK